MTEKVFHESITRASAYLWNLSEEEEEEEESRGKPKPGRLSPEEGCETRTAWPMRERRTGRI